MSYVMCHMSCVICHVSYVMLVISMTEDVDVYPFFDHRTIYFVLPLWQQSHCIRRIVWFIRSRQSVFRSRYDGCPLGSDLLASRAQSCNQLSV